MIYTKGITINGTQFLPSDYVTLNDAQTIPGNKTFSGLTKTTGKLPYSYLGNDLNNAIYNMETAYWGPDTANRPSTSDCGTLLSLNCEGNVHTSNGIGWMAQFGIGTDLRLYLRTKTNTYGSWENWKEFITINEAVPRSGGAVITGDALGRNVDNDNLRILGGTAWNSGAQLQLCGKDMSGGFGGTFTLYANSGSNVCALQGTPSGTLTWCSKNIAMQEDTIPRSGGAVLTGQLFRSENHSFQMVGGGTGADDGGYIQMNGENASGDGLVRGAIRMVPLIHNPNELFGEMYLKPDGTWTWTGQAVQLVSDQRLKQQITEIDDKLLDAWEDVNLVQFKYNDAVDQKGKDKARLHTGYVVQQIDKACKSHGVDVSQYGLYCHEEYPQETEEVEVEQEDGTKTKETKVIREASEHYSLRYTETLVVECAYLRKQIKELKERLEKLEGK